MLFLLTMLKSNLFNDLYQQLENPPKQWKIENISLKYKLKHHYKDLKHKFKYGIY